MKKAGLILLIMIYSISTFGVTLKEFYCCGKLKTVTVTLADSEKVKCNGGDEDSGCCKTKFHQFKVKDTHIASAEVMAPQGFVTDIHTVLASLLPEVLMTTEINAINGCHSPPLYSSAPLYLQNRVFRI